MSPPGVENLLQQVASTGIQAATSHGRYAALAAARALVDALESPGEKICRIAWSDPMLSVAVRLGVDMKLFVKLQEAGSQHRTADQLANSTSCDEVLLPRIVHEVGPDTYTSTSTSDLLATPEGAGPIVNCFTLIGHINSKIVDYFRTRNYKNPVNKNDSIFMHGYGTDKHYFEWCFAPGNEEEAEGFLNHVKLKTLGPKWYETVPVEEILGTSSGASDVLLVDVGGNSGQDVLNFHKAYPKLPGRLILEDLPSVVKGLDAKALEPVEMIGHDFFTEQPVKGAKAYYLKMVLHDWPDDSCVKILANLKPALKAGHSKILINEIVVPKRGAEWYTTGVDLLMMVAHSAQERREEEWKALAEGAGLKVVKIWDCGDAPEKLIEMTLP